MSAPRIAALRRRLTLEEAVRTDDAAGGAVLSWQLRDVMWAAVVPRVGAEGDRADATAAVVSHDIWLRHHTGVRPAMRFRDGARLFEILSVLEVDGARRWLKCRTREISP